MTASHVANSGGIKGIFGKFGQILGRTTQDAASTNSIANTVTIRPIVPQSTRWHTVQVSIEEADKGRQITDIICRRYAVSRPLVQRFLRDGKIMLLRAPKQAVEKDEKNIPIADLAKVRTFTPRQNMRVESGDLVTISEVFLPPKPNTTRAPRAGTDDLSEAEIEYVRNMVIYKDERIIIINKPSGLAVHGGPKIDTHLVKLLGALQFDNEEIPLLVHRLDRDTSGALILARTRPVAEYLASRFRSTSLDPSIVKTYLAMVKGKPDSSHMQGEIIANIYEIASSPNARMTTFADRRKELLDEGKPAITKYRWMQLHRCKETKTKLSLMELTPITGRTHQLRVHMAEQLGLPIYGDYRYFPNQLPGLKLHLHCHRVELRNWQSKGQSLIVKAPIPEHFIETMYENPLKLDDIPKFPKRKDSNN